MGSLQRILPRTARLMVNTALGKGEGAGGGGGGAVRTAGGKFGEMEAANEERYFRELQAKQLADMNKNVEKSIDFHTEEIADLQAQIEVHKRKIAKLEMLKKVLIFTQKRLLIFRHKLKFIREKLLNWKN